MSTRLTEENVTSFDLSRREDASSSADSLDFPNFDRSDEISDLESLRGRSYHSLPLVPAGFRLPQLVRDSRKALFRLDTFLEVLYRVFVTLESCFEEPTIFECLRSPDLGLLDELGFRRRR